VNWNDVVNNIKATRHFLLTTFNILNFTIKFKEDTQDKICQNLPD
jgi:hypothetical protein